jgi:septum formation protein
VAPPLILASASPRRRELLSQLGVPFEVVVAKVTENEDPTTDPRVMVATNAALKADWVASRYPEAIILGADTTVFVDQHTLNKPANEAEARAMLRRLSGRTHTVFTGLAIRCERQNLALSGESSSLVTFKTLDESVITTYLQRVHVYDKAGGYGIQDHGELIVAHYTGELANIIGLPLEATKQLLTQAGLFGSA